MTRPVPSGRSIDDLCPSRRNVVRTLALLGGVALVPGLAACSSDDSDSESASGGASESGSAASAGPATLATSDVAVGTAVVVSTGGGPVLVSQPTEGEFVAFSGLCTHENANVRGSDTTTVTCPAHGSEFDLADGAKVVQGPTKTPLPTVDILHEGDTLTIG